MKNNLSKEFNIGNKKIIIINNNLSKKFGIDDNKIIISYLSKF